MATIDEFKAQLIGGGPRANRFKIFIPRAGNRIEFLAKAGNIPARHSVLLKFNGEVPFLNLLETEHLKTGLFLS